jgi:hypothetical protein
VSQLANCSAHACIVQTHGAGEASAGPVGAEETNGVAGPEPDGANHQRSYNDPQPSRSAVLAQ